MKLSSKKDYEDLFSQVKKIVNKHDPMALSALYAPEDEYDGEVADLVRYLSKDPSAEDLAKYIYATFMSPAEKDTKELNDRVDALTKELIATFIKK